MSNIIILYTSVSNISHLQPRSEQHRRVAWRTVSCYTHSVKRLPLCPPSPFFNTNSEHFHVTCCQKCGLKQVQFLNNQIALSSMEKW